MDRFDRIKALQETRALACQAASAALANVETWLLDGRPHGTTLLDHDGPEPPLNKGEAVVDGIERLRRRVRELRADVHHIESALFPSTYCTAQMRGQIEALAQRGTPDTSLLVEHDREIIGP
ncbi:MAG TPA: hypothetical protein VFS91_11485 [Nitrobacter sp.]|nr:hypothetical protein [Nitrobacter sp.]